MATKICSLLLLISTLTSYTQNVILLKNFNPKVKELKHNLNHSRDSLLLECKNKIVKVDIFNEDYDHTYDVKNMHAQIPLNDLPKGKFVVEVQLVNKIAIMHVVKQSFDKDFNDSYNTTMNNSIAEGQGMMLDEKLNIIKSPPKHSIEFLLNRTKISNPVSTKRKFFWVVLEINTGINSHKSMKLVNESVAKKMISKNRRISKTNYSKKNKLSVWEVYDTTKFVKKQTANPNYINSLSSDVFNVEPYYTSENSVLMTAI